MIDSHDPIGLLSRVPAIRRTRGFRLYGPDGARYMDFWQFGGRASLGHSPKGVLLALKNAASQGLACPFPGPYGARLEKVLARLVPSHPFVRLYSDDVAASRAFVSAGFDPAAFSSAADPAVFSPERPVVCSLWRPWLDPEGLSSSPVLRPILPFPWAGSPVALLLREDCAAKFPRSSVVSPMILAAANRAAVELLSELRGRGDLSYPRLAAACLGRDRLAGPVSIKGPYLRFPEAGDSDAYMALFMSALAVGILIPPDPALPVILPPDLSPGEVAVAASFINGS